MSVTVTAEETREKFLDRINALCGAGDRDHALSSSLAAVGLPSIDSSGPNVRTYVRTNERRGERKWRTRVPARARTHARVHICEVRRGPRAPLSKKLTRPPYGEKILHPR